MVLSLVLFKDVIPSLLEVTHLHGHVEFHVVHGHLDNVVCLVNLLNLLLRLVAQDLNLRLSSLFGLLQLIVKRSFSLS